MLGGVISGVGKGVTSSGLARVFQTLGLRVGLIKLDPYLNFDAGLMSPYQHGEVFVLDGGREADLDLGTYERALDRALPGSASITSGQVLRAVLDRERAGGYLGQTVQYYPHVTDAYIEAVRGAIRDQGSPDVCVIEVGGTPSDTEAAVLLEAMRRLALTTPTAIAQVTYLAEPSALGEFKTKPAQASVEQLRRAGLPPDVVVCRAESRAPAASLAKIAGVAAPGRAVAMPNLAALDDVPVALVEYPTVGADFLNAAPNHRGRGRATYSSSTVRTLLNALMKRSGVGAAHDERARGGLDRLGRLERIHFSGGEQRALSALANLNEMQSSMRLMRGLLSPAEATAGCRETIWGEPVWRPQRAPGDDGLPVVALVAKYAKLMDAYLSLRTALQHAGFRVEFVDSEELEAPNSPPAAAVLRALVTRPVDPVRAVVVAGGFGSRGVEGKIAACLAAKALGVPTLAICLGLQTMAVAAARASGHPAAGLAECGAEAADAVVGPMTGHELDGASGAGGTLRCGARPVLFAHAAAGASAFERAYLECPWATVEVAANGADGADTPTALSAVRERFRHRHAVSTDWLARLAAVGVRVSAVSEVDGCSVPVALEWGAPEVELETAPDSAAESGGAAAAWYVGVQFHPEYNSGPTRPHPLFVALQKAAVAWRSK